MSSVFIALLGLLGCGDSCQQLCRAVGERLESCIDDDSSLQWADVRALGRQDFVDLCQEEWDDERRTLSSFDRTAALQECCVRVPLFDPGVRRVNAWCDDGTEPLTCDEVVALYGNQP